MELIVLTSEIFFDGEADMLNQLFDAGLTRLHVRKPGSGPEELQKLLKGLKPYFLRNVVLHQHFEVLADINFGGIHMKAELHQKMSPLQLREYSKKMKRFEKTISASFHSWKEIQEAPEIFDYVFVSPVFDSISKKEYKANADLQIIPGGITKKVIALGGVTTQSVSKAAEAGYAGVAVLGTLWESPKPEIVPIFKKLQTLCKNPVRF